MSRAHIPRMWLPGFAVLALCALHAEVAWGTTYYVRKTGANSNSGTAPSAAFLTVDKAANVAVAGDIVYVGAGVYNESVTPTNDGTAGALIQFIADTTGVKTGDAGNVDITKSGAVAFNIGGDNYILVSGFRLYGSNYGVHVGTSTGSVVQNCECYNNANSGIRCNSSTSVTINNCDSHNNATYGIETQSACTVTATNCKLRSNNHGAYTEAAGSSLTLIKCRMYANTSRGIYAKKGTVLAKNCLIYSNAGEGVYAETPSGPTITLWNSTIADNTLDGFYQKSGTATITNCILAFNGGAGIHYLAGTLTHTYNVLYGNTGGAYSGVSGSTGELTFDPKFIDRASADYHPNAGSPAINRGTGAAGIVDDDLDGVARPINSIWDIGCYESSLAGSVGLHITSWLEIP